MTVKWICEIGSNHNKSWERTHKLIKEAKRIGCDAVKFQLFRPELLYHQSFKAQIAKMRSWALPVDFIPEIKSACNDLDIEFGCSVFDLESVDIVKDFVDWLKIGSYENQWPNLIKAVAKIKKPWILSTGMLFLEEIYKIIGIYDKRPEAILHCVSNYPTLPQDCNLKQIHWLKMAFPSINIGWSDHTTEPSVIYRAILEGAEYIEFHLDLDDNEGFESQVGHCWKPIIIADVIHNVRIGELAEQSNDSNEDEAKKWRTDPEDGLRPLKKYREELLK